jgi:hypothetical protein
MSTKQTSDDIVASYLARLDTALRNVPPALRHPIIEEVAQHISRGRAELDPEDEVGLLTFLDQVGDPESIAAEVVSDLPPPSARRSDAFVPWLLLVGGLAVLIGWFIGVAMLWRSHTWGRRDKLLGTLVLPGGWVGLFVLMTRPTSVLTCGGSGGPGIGTVTHCTTTGFTLPPALGIPLLLILLVAPIVTAIHLDRQRRHVATS